MKIIYYINIRYQLRLESTCTQIGRVRTINLHWILLSGESWRQRPDMYIVSCYEKIEVYDLMQSADSVRTSQSFPHDVETLARVGLLCSRILSRMHVLVIAAGFNPRILEILSGPTRGVQNFA